MRELNDSSRRRRALCGLAVLVAAPLVAPAPADAGPAEHCVVEVTGQEADGRYLTTSPRCYGSYRSMLESIDVRPRSDSEDATVLGAEAVAMSTPLATHYENFNGLGSSLTIYGIGCTGGYANLDVAWRNRISSTYGYCGTIRHYDLLNKGGISEPTSWGLANLLLGLNNKTESVQYS